MNTRINLEKLNEVFTALRTAFDMNISFSNDHGVPLALTKAAPRTPLCTYLRSNPVFNQRCVASDIFHCHTCEVTGKPNHCKCHIGLEEYFYPVFCEGVLIGFIMTGQFFTTENREGVIRNIMTSTPQGMFDEQTIRRLILQQPILDMRKLEAIFKVLDLSISAMLKDDAFLVYESSLTQQIDVYIQNNLNADLSTTALCEAFKVSKTKLNRMANDFYGMSVQSYVRQCRINRSVELLSEGRCTILNIAQQVGIPDGNYFTKVFRATHGCSPTEYRRLAIGEKESSGRVISS